MKLNGIIVALCSVGILNAHAENVAIAKSSLVGDGIVEFVPQGFDQTKTPSLILKEEPTAKGSVPSDWELYPQFTVVDGKANASLSLTGEISLYGGGEVTGPLLRNGQYIKLWNTDTGAYGVDGGKRLYQSHPWVLGVRRDGSAFGILFDSSWKSELHTNSDKIEFNTEGALFRIYIIDRESPKDVLKGLAELTGTITMPARWTLGYHQCRFSYGSEQKVREIADNFRSRNIPCDAIWMDIDYMDGYRIFTFNETNFPDPK
ncbi:TIM-barrel domain-containing protein, partial [Barnesiella intestinihominis]